MIAKSEGAYDNSGGRSAQSLPPTSRTKRLRLPKRIFRNPPSFLKNVEFRPARSVKEMLAASHLVYKEYLNRGYVLPKKNELHFSLYQTLPTTVTFVAVHKSGVLLAASTLIEDSPLGVPMDTIYRNELDDLRAGKERFIEVGMLALDEKIIGKGDFTVTRSQRLLFLLMIYQAIYHYFRASSRIDALVACFHPNHEFMYDWIGFTPLGGLKSYSTVQGSPAVARHLVKKDQLVRALADPHTQDLMFFWDSAPASFQTLRFSAEELRELFVEKTDVLTAATPEQRTIVKQFYPGYDFDAILKPSTYVPPPAPPLMDVLLKNAGVKTARLEGPDTHAASVYHNVRHLCAALQSNGFERGDYLTVLASTFHEASWQIANQAAKRAGGAAVGLSLTMTRDEIRKTLRKFPSSGLIVENRQAMENFPDEFLDDLKFIVLFENTRRENDKTGLFEVMFSPPICVPARLFFWADFIEQKQYPARETLYDHGKGRTA